MATPLPGLVPLRRQQRPPKPRRPPVLPRGSLLIQSILRTTLVTEFTEKPDTFPGTVDEWYPYVGLAKIFDDPKEYRLPPYFGGVRWGYQLPFLGQFTRQAGSAVADFVVYLDAEIVVIRVQTPYFHLAAPAFVQGYDAIQRAQLGTQVRVIDIYTPDYIDDPTGQAIIVILKEALGFLERPSPISTGRVPVRF